MKNLSRERTLLTATVIRGRRVTLRHNSEGYTEEEIARRYRWSLDKELQYWSGSIPAAPTLAQFRNDIITSVHHADYRRDQFAILDERGTLIGMVSYYNWTPERGHAELGIYIGERNLWDKGYGTEAVRVLLDHLFTTTPLRAMYLNTYASNERARSSYRKAGFETVGTMRKYSSRIGYYIDVQMRITRDDFLARYRPGQFALGTGAVPVPRRAGAIGVERASR
jgi:RimJ/RimL family protein N-acetyltransferase